ncbi:efflux RND transporter periplasmic adaptor subunit [Lutispora sp.]|uniref:efflux RND transporter periplasmic adaptor subunit n=1 Tax=Lutispora sp. TaxID=2828727 RepID=UPI003569C2AE
MKFNTYLKYVLTIISILFLSFILYAINPAIGDDRAQVSYAAKKNLAQSIMVNGIVTAKNKEEIAVEKGKTVKRLFIEENSIVNKGDILFETDESDLILDIKRKELELTDAQLELENIKDMNLEKENRDNEQAVKELEFDIMAERENLKDLEENYNVNKELYEMGFISKKDLETEEYKYNKALTELELLENRYELEKDKVEEFVDNYDKKKSQKIDMLSKRIELLKLELSELYKKGKETNTAGINGEIVSLDLREGEKVNTAGPHIIIYDLSELYIDIIVEQRYASYLKVGDAAEIIIPGLIEEEIYGSIYSIDKVVSSQSINEAPGVSIKVKIDKPDKNIKVGYRANVKLIFNIRENAVSVDYRAIVTDRKDNEFVYVVKDGIATRTYVETGIKNDFDVEITKGLIQGDQYIVNPSEKMRDKNSFRLWRYEIR